MKLRNFEEALRRDNLIKDLKDIESTSGTITTIDGTTLTYTNVYGTTKVSGATIEGDSIKGISKVVIPAAAYTASSPGEVAIYATASYLFVGDAGVWKSAALV